MAARLISTITTTSVLVDTIPFPPKPQPKASKQNHLQPPALRFQIPIKISRRLAVSVTFLSFFPAICQPEDALAFSFGIPGPKEWLKEQKKKSSSFLLAPIGATRESLRSVYLLLTSVDYGITDKNVEEIQLILKSSARDCIPGNRNSIVAFQSSTGVEVCTFKLVVKNASSLLDDKDPLKLQAEAKLDDLIRSFISLNGLASGIGIQLASNRQQVADALMNTISSLDKFEKGVMDCIEI